MSQRLKGQEVSIDLISDGQIQTTLRDVKDMEIAAQLEIKSEGYLGETTNRRDDVFNGAKGSMTVHFENGGPLDFIAKIIDRARRRTPGFAVNVKATLIFPGGDLRRVLMSDCYFAEFPINAGGRTDYVSIKLDFESQDIRFL